MKLEQAHIAQIKTAFQAMQSKEDFLHLLNAVKPFIYGKKAISFEMKQLTWHANPQLGGKRYVEFVINKKSGGDRKILAPVNGLKAIQRTINLVLQCVYEPSAAAMGFVKDRSIITNANMHIGHYYVYNIDLKDFFPSIDQARVWKTLQLKPFNLIGTNRLEIANLIASLCCAEMEVERKKETGEWRKTFRKVLPQGAPTSPIISNIVCQKLDFLLLAVAKRFGLTYSRYADDITFSSLHNVYQPDGDFLKELNRIIAQQNFHVKESKTRLQKEGYRMEVTGLTVNEKANVQQRYIKQLRAWLYYWERYGFERASVFFAQQYLSDKTNVTQGMPDMAKVISGKLEYLKMVKGPENELFLNLHERFEKLIGRNASSNKIAEKELPIITYEKTIEIANRETFSEINFKEIASDTPSPVDKKEQVYPIFHNPEKTVRLLKYFTENDKDLKYSTHSWEEGKYEGYDDYITKISKEWNSVFDTSTDEKFGDVLKKQVYRLHAKISSFLFNNKLGQKKENGHYDSWGEKYLKFGWASPELKLHMSESGKSPFSCPIPENIKTLDRKHNLIYFKDYADAFKNEIEFREDSNNFKKMIIDLWDSELSYDFDISGIKELVGFSFFTDVSYVKGVIKILFGDMFKTKPEFPQVVIEKQSFFIEGGYHLIRITQENSFVTRDINDPKFKTPTGNLQTIIKNLYNLADYSIISRFADGKYYRINYLISCEKPFIEELETPISKHLGFTHEFKFYL